MKIDGLIAYQQFYMKNKTENVSAQNKVSSDNDIQEMSLSGHTPWSKQDYFDKIDSDSTVNTTYKSYINVNNIDPNLSQDERDKVMVKNMLKNALAETGLTGQSFETLEIGLDKNKTLTVSGLSSDSDNRKLADTINDMLANRSPFGSVYTNNKTNETSEKSGMYKTRMQAWAEKLFYKESEWSLSGETEHDKSHRAELIRAKYEAPQFAEKNTGMTLDFSKLYRSEDGKIAGYPEELSWYFEQEIEEPSITNPKEPTKQEGYALIIRKYAEDFLEVGYENIPDADSLNHTFKFSMSDLM
jgi:hypothetical protein